MAIIDRFRRRKDEEDQTTTGTGPMWASAPTEPYYNGGDIPEYGTGTVGVGAFERPSAAGLMIDESLSKPVIGKDQVRKAMDTLRKYKAGKTNFDRRVIENEEWWKLRHWQHIKERGTTTLEAKSSWLINVLMSKHADAMDALPEPNLLPRAADDQEEAQQLSKIIPVILRRNNFDKTWSVNWWKKMIAGAAFYGVFWDRDALNGLGDVAVRKIDPLALFWEPGITDLQDSRNIFLVTLTDNETLEEAYPELKDKLKGGKELTKGEYLYDDHVDTSDKSPVVDWYYKKHVGGKTILHYAKFVGEHVLFATENDPELTDRGWYDHGLYPFFADAMLPEEGTPTGYGYVDICKDAQRQIDLMNNAIVANAIASATPRWMVRGDGGVNEEEYADWTKPFVHVQGSMDEAAIRQITVNPMPGNLLAVLDSKINEMKETSGNRDVNNGGSAAGVTAASAIAAMQEQSGKLSRDQIQNSYNCFSEIVYMIIELIRQFYDLPRKFRILGEDGQAEFVNFDNQGLRDQPIPGGVWRPVFDIEVSAQKQSPYNKLSYNELAIQFFQLGFFNPQMADPALAAIEMMDFKGKEQVRQRIQQNGGMMQMIQQLMLQVQMLQAQHGIGPGPEGGSPEGQMRASAPTDNGEGKAKGPEQTNSLGEPEQQNRYIEKGRQSAQAATQPR
jgi:hypothetical protein